MRRLRIRNEYSENVWVVWGCTRLQYEAYLKRRYKDKAPETGGFYRGCVDEIEGGVKPNHFYLWFARDKQVRLTIIHETNHLSFRLLMYAGVKHSTKTEEVFAYLQEYFCGQIFNALKGRRNEKP